METDFRLAVFPGFGALYRPPEFVSHQLGSIADPKNRNAQLENSRITFGCIFVGYRLRAAGKHNSTVPGRSDLCGRGAAGFYFAKNMQIPYSSSYQLAVLASKIKDKDGFIVFHTVSSHSTVTDFARLRGLSISQPFREAT